MHQLAILAGQTPASLIALFRGRPPARCVPPRIPVNLPSELLRQRPDIRAAERRLAAATAEIGVATADLFPKFSLAGLIGLQSSSLGDLISSGSRYWSIGPAVNLSLFDQGKVRAAIEISEARRDAALAEYEQTVLTALAEVEDGLVAFAQEQETRRNPRRSGHLRRKGGDDRQWPVSRRALPIFSNVLQSERALYQSQDQLAQSEQRLTLAMVAIFKALGGGWQTEETSETTLPATTAGAGRTATTPPENQSAMMPLHIAKTGAPFADLQYCRSFSCSC